MTTTLQDPEVGTMMTKARTALILDEPFFGNLVMNLQFVEDLTIQTLCVSRSRVRYNPKFIRELSPGQIKTALAHEVGHCVYDSFGRRGEKDPRGWNIATDYTINEMLDKAGFEHIDGWLLNQAYYGMTADHIYTLLPKDKNGNHPGTGDEGGSLDDTDETQSADDMTDTDWKIATIQAANEARKQGKLPATLERFVEEITNPQVDWRAYFLRWFTERSRNDYSWTRPNKRFAHLGLILPSLYSESMGETVFMVDTSGSITQDTLDAFGSEVTAAHAATRPTKLYVIYCDSEVNHVDEFGPNDELHFKLHGGGGTDFRPPFQWLEERGITPSVGVYLTDLYGPEPETPPPYPFLWCCTTDKVGSFGDTIKVNA